MSISKVNKSSTIIRRPDYARKDVDNVTEIEISNKDSRLNNNIFNDLVFFKQNKKDKDSKDDKKDRQKESAKEETSTSIKNKDGQTDFYV